MGSIAGLLLFSLLGYFVPYLYYSYIDNTEHYYIRPNPLSVDNKDRPISPCDTVVYRGTRTSMIDFITETSVDLVRVEEDGSRTKIFTSEQSLKSIERGQTNIEYRYTLPCNLNPGNYYLSSVITYEIWNVDKAYRWTSEEFKVVK